MALAAASRAGVREMTGTVPTAHMDLTVLIPAFDEAENLRLLLPSVHRAAQELSLAYEVLVVDVAAHTETLAVTRDHGARVITQVAPGYGGALTEGFREAQGDYVLTMDADCSHEPSVIAKLWAHRNRADIIVASRYTRGGVAYMSWVRKWLSRVLNRVFTRGLSMDVRDISSGFRLYKASVVKGLPVTGTDFDILPEIIVRAHLDGWSILEVPFTYFPRAKGTSRARVIRVGINLLKTFAKLWRLRHSVRAADYDERAFYSPIPLQRYWQRRRHRIVTTMARGRGRTLDVGCGSSLILQSLNHAVGLDVLHYKMRYMRRYGLEVVTGSVFALPFADESMDCVICSEVIEHVPADPAIFVELDRVLRPGGLLILGTPDYATWTWPLIERLYGLAAPGGYACEHISHYTRDGIQRLLDAMGYDVMETRYVFGSELIVSARKGPGRAAPDAIALLLPATHTS